MALRIVFLGAGKLAEPVFSALCESRHTICGLVTQPEKSGPGHHRHVNPLKEQAVARGIPVLQPVRLRRAEAVAELRALQPELQVVAAYGQLLSDEVLSLPRLGTINVHASLLPRYRGATPIHAAVLNGDTTAGVTIIRLVQQLDAGPMLGRAELPVGPHETTGELEIRLAALSVPLTLSVIDQLEHGTVVAEEQNHALATHVGKLTKADGAVDWSRSATELACHVRGMQPWPGAHTQLHQDGRPPLSLKLIKTSVVSTGESQLSSPAEVAPGTIVAVTNERLIVQCGEGRLAVERLHPDGKKALEVTEFLRGRPIAIGSRFVSLRPADPTG
jgi:methionyl-tRNA formyltransferase